MKTLGLNKENQPGVVQQQLAVIQEIEADVKEFCQN